MDNKEMMKKIAEKVGREKAIDLVMQAYNTELLTTWLSRMEVDKPQMMAKGQLHDHLRDAMERVLQVCDLTN